MFITFVSILSIFEVLINCVSFVFGQEIIELKFNSQFVF